MDTRFFKLLSVSLLLALLPPSLTLAAPAAKTCSAYGHLTFGILPFVSNEQMVRQFSPMVQYLSKELSLPVRIETAPNFAEFAKRTQQGDRYDILFTAPHFYPRASDQAGYRLIASVDSSGLWAIIVVPKDSNIHDIDDLKGKTLATVQEASLATLLVRRYLKSEGIDPDKDLTLVSTPSHDASLLSTFHGVTDASSLMRPQYAGASETVRDSMTIIARTESTPHIPISVSKRISDSCAAEISALFIGMNSNKEGQQALSHNRFSGFRKAQVKEYDRMRDLFGGNKSR